MTYLIFKEPTYTINNIYHSVLDKTPLFDFKDEIKYFSNLQNTNQYNLVTNAIIRVMNDVI